MSTRAQRPMFTTNRQRGNAGSPTLNHTTITRAGPSASLGDDPHPPAHSGDPHHRSSTPTYMRTDFTLDIDYTQLIWE